MKILVINTGSSSIKYELFDMAHHKKLAWGIAEKIGEDKGLLSHCKRVRASKPVMNRLEVSILNHEAGMRRIIDLLTHSGQGAVTNSDEITAVGHRVVHGGEKCHSTTIIDAEVVSAIRESIPLAPLHNPSNLMGIEVAIQLFPRAIQVAVFDTAFHQTLPMRAFLYAIPFDLYEKERIRRYGFHGTSHAYVAEKAATYMGRHLRDLNLITIHLGNGASMTAVKGGRSMDTTMGMTPLAGLVMGSRSGDVDPSLPVFLARHLGMSLEEIDTLLNEKSGLKGMCGTNDMREVIQRMETGDDRAAMAIDIYTYRIRKYIGAYLAALEHVDAIIFTAGVGENAPRVRELSCRGLSRLGIALDPEKNIAEETGIREISTKESPVKVLVVPTDEGLRIAQETERACRIYKERPDA